MKYRLSYFAVCALSYFSYGQVTVHSEDFQSGTLGSYTIVDNDGLTPNAAVSEFADAWIILEDPDMPNDTVAGSTSYFEPIGTASRWLISPQINLGGYGNYLYWDAKSHDASFPDSYHVYISTTDDQLASFTDTILNVFQELDVWTTYEINLSELGYDGQSIYIAIVNNTEDGFKLYIDDIKVDANDPRGLRPVGLNELNQPYFSIYPNPVQSVVTIDTDHFELISLFDNNGKMILSSKENKLDLSALNSGSYLLGITIDGTTYYEKVLKH